MNEDIIKNPKRLITNELIINEFEDKFKQLQKKEDSPSSLSELKRNFILKKTLKLRSNDKERNVLIAKKFLLENFYTNEFLLNNLLETTNYFKTKKADLVKVVFEQRQIKIISIDNSRIFTTSLIFKKNLNSFKYRIHLLNNEPLLTDSLNATVNSFQIKQLVKKQFNLILKKWKKISSKTKKLDIENILKLDFNNLK